MQLSVAMPPGPQTRSSTRSSPQELGYDRVWLFDSAALYEDIWIWLARLAEHTDIDLGTAVLVPNLRHVMTTASAIATIERMAPGRLACGFGTGATARWVLNQTALSWATTRRYLEQLRGAAARRGRRDRRRTLPDDPPPRLGRRPADRHAAARLRARTEGHRAW